MSDGANWDWTDDPATVTLPKDLRAAYTWNNRPLNHQENDK